MLEQVGDEPARSCPWSASSSTNRRRPAGVAVHDQVADAEERLLLDGAEQLEDALDRDRPSVAAASWSSVDTASRKLPRALRATSASAASGASIFSASATVPQELRQLGQPRPREHERLAARADGREHLRELGRAEDEDEVGRRLLDQLEERVESSVRELVRLVEDVDLVAALRPAGGRRGPGSRGCRRSRAGSRRPSRSRRAKCRTRSCGTSCRCRRARSSGPARSSAPWPGCGRATSCRFRAARRRDTPAGPDRDRSRSAACGRWPPVQRPRRRSEAGIFGRARSRSHAKRRRG